jgi:sensor histidine kinase YesM
LPLSLQLLVENALKHNEISSRHPLLVEIYTLDNYLVVKNKKRLRKMLDTSPGIGLQNISQRYNLLANKDIIITNDDEYFVVNVPLCPSIPQKDTQKDTTHECCNH